MRSNKKVKSKNRTITVAPERRVKTEGVPAVAGEKFWVTFRPFVSCNYPQEKGYEILTIFPTRYTKLPLPNQTWYAVVGDKVSQQVIDFWKTNYGNAFSDQYQDRAVEPKPEILAAARQITIVLRETLNTLGESPEYKVEEMFNIVSLPVDRIGTKCVRVGRLIDEKAVELCMKQYPQFAFRILPAVTNRSSETEPDPRHDLLRVEDICSIDTPIDLHTEIRRMFSAFPSADFTFRVHVTNRNMQFEADYHGSAVQHNGYHDHPSLAVDAAIKQRDALD